MQLVRGTLIIALLLNAFAPGDSQAPADAPSKIVTDPSQLPAAVRVSSVEFIGISDIQPLSGFREIAEDYEGKTFHDTEWAQEIGEKARDAAQQAGYFLAQISTKFVVTPAREGYAEVTATLTVDKGELYRLKDIDFTGAKEFTPERL